MTGRGSPPAFLTHCSEGSRAVFTYWDRLRGDRLCPRRAELDPLDIPKHLPGFVMVEVVTTDPLDLRYRLVGTRAVEYRGQDPTGKRVSEAFYGTTLEEALQTYQSVIDSREPLFRDDPMQRDDYKQIREERLFLPFSEDGETVNLILVFISERPT